MGGCSSTVDEDEREAIETSKKIDKDNAKDYLRNAEKIKILLLGLDPAPPPPLPFPPSPPSGSISPLLQVLETREKAQFSSK
jgi:hypothetical protein